MEFKKLKTWITIIFLGALGSGIWSLAGEPTAGFLVNTIVSIGGWIGQTFGDLMNSGIGTGGWEDRGSVLVMIFMIWGVAIFSVAIISSLVHNPHHIFAAAVMMFFLCIFVTSKSAYSHKMYLYFDKNIEIIAPKLERKEILELRSLFRQIDDLSTFETAQSRLTVLAVKAGFEIERFSP